MRPVDNFQPPEARGYSQYGQSRLPAFPPDHYSVPGQPPQDLPAQFTPSLVYDSASSGPLGWWHRIAAPNAPGPQAPFVESERYRRGQLASTIILGLIVVELIGLPIGFSDTPTLIGLCAGLAANVIAIILNRTGHIAMAGILLVVVVDLALAGAVIAAPQGLVSMEYLPLYRSVCTL